MVDFGDGLAERGRSLEEDYFRKKDRELVEKMKLSTAAQQARDAIGQKTGLTDPAVLQELHELGFTPETIVLLPLIPVIEVAWSEGGITSAERQLIATLARSRGVAPGSAADGQLEQWMANRPAPAVFDRAGRLIAALLASGSEQSIGGLTASDLVAYCEKIASASGGILGIGKISSEERALLSRIADDLKGRRG
jgi:hypothetical protein